MIKRSDIRLLIAVIIGLAVAGVSVYYLLNFAADYQEMAKIIVTKENISAYEELTKDKLGVKSVPAGSVDRFTAVDFGQVLGKITTVQLYKESWIDIRNLTKKELADTSKQHVAININLTRSVGGTLKPGDIVDVYYIIGEQVPGALLADNCRLLKLMDNMGNEIGKEKNTGGILEEAQKVAQRTGLPAVAVLAVDPGVVPDLIRGSFDKSTGVVLVKKFNDRGGDKASAGTVETAPKETAGTDKQKQPEKEGENR